MTRNDAGFTLVEMLVGLLVLSFSAIALSTTLSSAFSSFKKVQSVNKDILDIQHLSLVLSDIGRSYFFQNIESDVDKETRIRFEPDTILMTQDTPTYSLILRQTNTPEQIIWESPNPIELSIESLTVGTPNRSRRQIASRPHLVVKTLSDDIWIVKAQAPLIVSESAECQYDIVGRRCR